MHVFSSRAGSDTTVVGCESVAFSHLSETMKALLETFPERKKTLSYIRKRKRTYKKTTIEEIFPCNFYFLMLTQVFLILKMRQEKAHRACLVLSIL